MNLQIRYRMLLGASFTCLCILIGCVEYKDPALIYEPQPAVVGESPTITALVPADSAPGGVREIRIEGANFSTNPYYNFVYFNKQPALLKSVSPTSLILYRPPIYGDSVLITVQVHGGLEKASRYYKIANPVYPYQADAIRTLRPSDPLMAVEVDRNEVIYIAKSYYIYKITSDATAELYKRFSGADFTRIYDIKFGPGGYLYLAASKSRIWRTQGESGTAAEQYVTFPSAAGTALEKIDFDQYGNLFTGKTRGIFVASAAKQIYNSGRYSSNFTITDIRVYNNELYVYANYTGSDASIPKKAIWKNTIYYSSSNTVDSLGRETVVLNFSSYDAFSNADITSFTFDNDGTLYLCIKYTGQSHSFYVLEANGELVPFYSDFILPSQVDQVVWGSGKTLYLNRGRTAYIGGDSAQVYRVPTLKQGAPYYGRGL